MKKKLILIILIITLSILTFLLIIKYVRKNNVEDEAKIINKIEEYGYVLEDNMPKLHKTYFDELVELLNKTDIDEEKYANLVVKLFISDFYNIENKITKNDVGGLQYIHSTIKDNVALNARNTIYKYIENNIDGKRTQELPKVTDVNIVDTKQVTYTYGDQRDEKAYIVKVSWKYKADLGYQKEASITLVHEGKKLSIVELK
ncbi:MAG TPA: hypothetical protein GXZ95_03320 [Mollicutes bacterium]|nr:hypothetical protein [Mollicutes bacterium]